MKPSLAQLSIFPHSSASIIAKWHLLIEQNREREWHSCWQPLSLSLESTLTHDLVGDGGRHHEQPHQPVGHGQGHHKAVGHCAQAARGQHGRNHKGVAHLRTNTAYAARAPI